MPGGESGFQGLMLMKYSHYEFYGDMRAARVAVDFDGTVMQYEKGWHDGSCYGDPFPQCFETLRHFQSRGLEIVVFTCRKPLRDVTKWFMKHKIQVLEEVSAGKSVFVPLVKGCSEDLIVAQVTDMKPVAELYIDDRSLRFEGSWQKTAKQASSILSRISAVQPELQTVNGRTRRSQLSAEGIVH